MYWGFLLAFVLGSIPTAYWYSKWFHQLDIRKYGSGNMGATNAYRILGKKAGLIVFFIDIFKGFIPVVVIKMSGFPAEIILLTGIIAVLGHIFSPLVSFKGGKGIATAFGVILGFAPFMALICLTVFFTILYYTRYVSLSSLLAILIFSLYLFFFSPEQWPIQLMAIGLFVLVVFTHRDNIKRLITNKESKL